jgi:hypothetical protein
VALVNSRLARLADLPFRGYPALNGALFSVVLLVLWFVRALLAPALGPLGHAAAWWWWKLWS